ncbi:unnamed protein product, partial [Choristocarpus tenellus]
RLWVPFDEEAVIPLILGYMGVFNVLLFTVWEIAHRVRGFTGQEGQDTGGGMRLLLL